jgi:hypothetical protein
LGQIHRAGGTKFLAGLASALYKIDAGVRIDGILERHRLRIKQVRCLPLTQALVELIGYPLGALLGTEATSDAFVRVNIPGAFFHLHRKPARLPG